ncbi:MAG: hypothetical protein D6788_08940 [Planctomycetota bacterium]|nr:MAG: hypothetical protein D6788_08940 [Planctomycetota bacterium]
MVRILCAGVFLVSHGFVAQAAPPTHIPPREVKQTVTDISIYPTDNPVTLAGRFLKAAANRGSLALVQVRDGDRHLHESVLVKEGDHPFRPAGRARRSGAAVAVWGTTDGLRAVAKDLGHENRRVNLDGLPLGTAALAQKDLTPGLTAEAAVIVDLGDGIVWLFYDKKDLIGARLVSSESTDHLRQPVKRALRLMARQRMASIRLVYRSGLLPGDSAGASLRETCCVNDACGHCCCETQSGCRVTDGGHRVICGTDRTPEFVCTCNSPGGCACEPPPQSK